MKTYEVRCFKVFIRPAHVWAGVKAETPEGAAIQCYKQLDPEEIKDTLWQVIGEDIDHWIWMTAGYIADKIGAEIL